MNDSESRRRQMFVRVRDFGQAHTSDFAPTSLAQQYFTNIGTRIGEVDTHASSEASGRSDFPGGSGELKGRTTLIRTLWVATKVGLQARSIICRVLLIY